MGPERVGETDYGQVHPTPVLRHGDTVRVIVFVKEPRPGDRQERRTGLALLWGSPGGGDSLWPLSLPAQGSPTWGHRGPPSDPQTQWPEVSATDNES